MHRVDTPDKAVDLFGSGKHGYKDGSPPASSSTATDKDTFNALQEEIVGVVENAGDTLLKTNFAQLLSAIKHYHAAQALTSWDQIGDTSGVVNEIAYSATLEDYLAVGSGTVASLSIDGGATWAAKTKITGAVNDIHFANGLWVLVGSGGTVDIQTTADGTTYNNRLEIGGAEIFRSVWYEASVTRWVAVGDSGLIYSSTDATSWAAETPGSSYTGAFRSVIFSQGLFVAVGTGDEVQTSPDGDTWTRRTSPGDDDYIKIVHNGVTFVALQGDGGVFTSPDGIVWSEVASTESTVADMWVFGETLIIRGADNIWISSGAASSWRIMPQSAWPVFAAASSMADLASDGGRILCIGINSDLFRSMNAEL